jgi:hypothetical protein
MANHYRLSGHGIELEYRIGAGPSVPALSLTDNGVTRAYLAAEITTDQTDLGTLVSVPLAGSPDTGGSRFGFFLPAVNVAVGQRTAVTTSGVIQTYAGPNQDRPSIWSCVHLHGIASGVVTRLHVAA